MAFKPTMMNQVKEILRDLVNGQPIKKAARIHRVSKNTIKKYYSILKTSGLDISTIDGLPDTDFHHLFYENKQIDDTEISRSKNLSENLTYFRDELTRVGVTRELLWNEYIVENPAGYSYSRFCRKLKEYKDINEATIRIEHKAAYRMMVDFAGSKPHWVDPKTGEMHYCEVLVTTLPFSSMVHVYAVPSQKQSDFVLAINEAMKYIGGTPAVLTSDNLKSYVTKASKYEPKFTDFCQQMGAYYGIELDATRVAKPKDKANVERHVSIVYSKVYAPLRDRIFHSIEEINTAFREQLDILNNTKMQGKSYSRREKFDKDEKPHLRPLPPTMFEVNKSTIAKVQRNYHVILGENYHYYSVPYQYIGKQTQIIYTQSSVEIYHGTERIAIHKRDHREHAYSTIPAHMPEKHVKYMEQKGWDADYFKQKATLIGPKTLWAIETILNAKHIVEQTYNACLGILRLGEKYGVDRLENACTRASASHRVTYTILHIILQNNMDKIPLEPQDQIIENPSIPNHENLRGPTYYSQSTLDFLLT